MAEVVDTRIEFDARWRAYVHGFVDELLDARNGCRPFEPGRVEINMRRYVRDARPS